MTKVVFDTHMYENGIFSTPWSYLTDKNGQPCEGSIRLSDDHIECVSPQKNFSLNALLEVPCFGKVVLRTSVVAGKNRRVDLLDSLITGRIDQIKQELQKDKLYKTIKFISQLLKLEKEKNSQKKLRKLMILGEKVVLEKAERELEKRRKTGEVKNVIIGGQAFGIERGGKYRQVHEESFDLGVAPLYFFLLKERGREETNWQLTDKIVDWLVKTKRIVKGHPLLWLHPYALPSWMKELTYPQFKKFLVEHITSVVIRYKDRIKIWDIANELPCSDANGFNLNLEQLLEILKLVSDLVKKLQPEAHRIINFSDIWAAGSYIHDKPSVPPVYFLKLCQKKGIGYEAIGLQFYMGLKKDFTCRELLNISRTVDEFAQFGKTIHFSETGFPSKHDVDPGCFFSSDHPEAGGYWHRRWDEKLQAEFLEKIITIFASKPKAASIVWWDLTDNGEGKDIGSRFLTFSGLTRRDFSPKPALIALQKFKKLRHF